MITPHNPEPEEVLHDLSPLLTALFPCLEAAAQGAREFFDSQSAPVDPFLFPCLVRYYAKLHLDAAGQECEYELDDIANNGLSLRYGAFLIRVLKSDDGRLPVPGPSRVKQAFFCQQFSIPFPTEGRRETAPTTLNLVVLWDVDGLHNLEGLQLVYPKAGGLSRASVEVYWEIPVPHPASMIAGEPQITVADELDIKIKEKRKTGTSLND